MYLGDSRLTEYKFPSAQGESPQTFKHDLCQRPHNIVKVKPQKIHSLFLKLHLICNCFCHISLSTVSYSEGERSLTSSSLFYITRHAVLKLKCTSMGTNGAFADDFSKTGMWTSASLENLQRVGRNLNVLLLQRKPLARGVRLHCSVRADHCQKGWSHLLLSGSITS